MTLKGDGGDQRFGPQLIPVLLPPHLTTLPGALPHTYKTGAMVGNNYGAEDFIVDFIRRSEVGTKPPPIQLAIRVQITGEPIPDNKKITQQL
jgi:hypothetical protein